MERAGRIILGRASLRQCLDVTQFAWALWRGAVGSRVANRTVRVYLEDAVLTVEVPDEIWQRQLESLKPQILANLGRVAGDVAIRDVVFRVAAPKKQPGVAGAIASPQGRPAPYSLATSKALPSMSEGVQPVWRRKRS